MTATAIVSALRSGVVPAQGLELFATGLEALEAQVAEELAFVAAGHGATKWLRGDYGAGKTFAARYLCGRARARGFATAEVQVSINDTPLHHLETVYRRLIERLQTADEGPNAFDDVVARWLYMVGNDAAAASQLAEGDPRLPAAMERRLEDLLSGVSARNPAFAQALRAYHVAKEAEDYARARGLLSWLAGQPHTASPVLAAAGVRGKVDGQAALTFLAGVLLLLRQVGYAGLVVVLDEVETIQRMPAQNREKALNVLRQLTDAVAAGELPGLYLVVTGTREFFEGYKGLKALPPLAQRVEVDFADDARFDNLRAPQVRLQPFDAARLRAVGLRVRALYPATHPERVAAKVTDAYVDALVQQLAGRFGGNVAVLPRLFLRALVDALDRVDQHEAYELPAPALNEDALTDEELAVLAPPAPRKPRRLDD